MSEDVVEHFDKSGGFHNRGRASLSTLPNPDGPETLQCEPPDVGRCDMTLKILLIVEACGGGTGRHVIDLAKGLVRRGHEVHIIHSPVRAERQFEQELHQLHTAHRIAVRMHRTPYFSDITALWAVRKYLAAHGPFDIVHGHSSKGGIIARLASLGLNTTKVYTPHCLRTLDPGLSQVSKMLYLAMERVTSQFTDAIIAVSQEELSHCLDCGFDEEKLHLVVNGISPAGMPPRQELRTRIGVRESEVLIGFIGRMVPQKAPQRMIQAFAEVATRHSGAKLVMIGDGPLKTPAMRQARQLGLEHRVIWASGDEGRSRLSAFDVFAMPSRYEAMPYVLLEALAAGLPIVATDVGGASSAVASGINGFVTPNWDVEKFANKLTRIVADDDLRCRMSKSSVIRSHEFTLERMLDKTVRVYQMALRQKSKQGKPKAFSDGFRIER